MLSKPPPSNNIESNGQLDQAQNKDLASTVARPAPVTNAANAFDAKSFLSACSQRAGVYQMYDHNGDHLYIGKAKNLKKRLTSYFRNDHPSAKTSVMVSKIARIDVTVTTSET